MDWTCPAWRCGGGGGEGMGSRGQFEYIAIRKSVGERITKIILINC